MSLKHNSSDRPFCLLNAGFIILSRHFSQPMTIIDCRKQSQKNLHAERTVTVVRGYAMLESREPEHRH